MPYVILNTSKYIMAGKQRFRMTNRRHILLSN